MFLSLAAKYESMKDRHMKNLAGNGKTFTNKSLDNAFIAPEMLFQKFNEHTASLDVWGFGTVLYSVLFGKIPDSFYKIYRDWFKRFHLIDVEEKQVKLPFIPPNGDSFIFDPFSISMNTNK